MFGKLKSLGLKASDVVTRAIGTWTFVVLYSFAMLIWIFLHTSGTIQIDGPDFIKWNLFLSYFAGIQASIVLMSTTRQAERDRIKHEEQLEELADKITEYSRYAELTSDLIEDYLKEVDDKGDHSES